MSSVKRFINKALGEGVYRLLTVIRGPISDRSLRRLLEREMYGFQGRNALNGLMREAFKRELIAYATAWDAWAMREVDDPFICSPIIERYEGEFRDFAETQVYQPGGMIHTELLVLYSLIRHCKPDVFIESGTMNAYSSVFIAEALRRNGSNSRLYCLSLFDGDEYRVAQERLQGYEFVDIRKGRSEILIDEVARKHGDQRVAVLVDGPKARSKGWDILTGKVAQCLPGLLFICFDAAQEHVPYYCPQGVRYDPKRSINIERLKTIRLFEDSFRRRGYRLAIQSNQFCRNYHYLNDVIYKHRNDRWGHLFPWGPYRVDRIANHIAHSYKLAVICKESILSKGNDL